MKSTPHQSLDLDVRVRRHNFDNSCKRAERWISNDRWNAQPIPLGANRSPLETSIEQETHPQLNLQACFIDQATFSRAYHCSHMPRLQPSAPHCSDLITLYFRATPPKADIRQVSALSTINFTISLNPSTFKFGGRSPTTSYLLNELPPQYRHIEHLRTIRAAKLTEGNHGICC